MLDSLMEAQSSKRSRNPPRPSTPVVRENVSVRPAATGIGRTPVAAGEVRDPLAEDIWKDVSFEHVRKWVRPYWGVPQGAPRSLPPGAAFRPRRPAQLKNVGVVAAPKPVTKTVEAAKKVDPVPSRTTNEPMKVTMVPPKPRFVVKGGIEGTYTVFPPHKVSGPKTVEVTRRPTAHKCNGCAYGSCPFSRLTYSVKAGEPSDESKYCSSHSNLNKGGPVVINRPIGAQCLAHLRVDCPTCPSKIEEPEVEVIRPLDPNPNAPVVPIIVEDPRCKECRKMTPVVVEIACPCCGTIKPEEVPEPEDLEYDIVEDAQNSWKEIKDFWPVQYFLCFWAWCLSYFEPVVPDLTTQCVCHLWSRFASRSLVLLEAWFVGMFLIGLVGFFRFHGYRIIHALIKEFITTGGVEHICLDTMVLAGGGFVVVFCFFLLRPPRRCLTCSIARVAPRFKVDPELLAYTWRIGFISSKDVQRQQQVKNQIEQYMREHHKKFNEVERSQALVSVMEAVTHLSHVDVAFFDAMEWCLSALHTLHRYAQSGTLPSGDQLPQR